MKKRHKGRQSVLLDAKATPVVRRFAKADNRSLNYTASRIITEYGLRNPG